MRAETRLDRQSKNRSDHEKFQEHDRDSRGGLDETRGAGDPQQVERITPHLSAERIAARVGELAREIVASLPDPENRELVLVVILKGAFVFAADLARALCAAGASTRVEFIRLSSYGDAANSSGVVKVFTAPPDGLAGRQVLLIDDILDTGRSLHQAKMMLEKTGAEVRLCVLLDKPSRREVAVDPDFIGFEIPNRFVVGYGIDYAEEFRDLPFIAFVNET